MSNNIKCHNHLYDVYNKIQQNSVIALDSHPASYFMLDYLKEHEIKVSIVTFSTDILRYITENTNFNIIFTSGKIDSALHIITGSEVLEKIRQLKIDYYFCEASYIDEKDRLFQLHQGIAELQRGLIQRSELVYLLNYPDISNSADLQKLSLIGQLK